MTSRKQLYWQKKFLKTLRRQINWYQKLRLRLMNPEQKYNFIDSKFGTGQKNTIGDTSKEGKSNGTLLRQHIGDDQKFYAYKVALGKISKEEALAKLTPQKYNPLDDVPAQKAKTYLGEAINQLNPEEQRLSDAWESLDKPEENQKIILMRSPNVDNNKNVPHTPTQFEALITHYQQERTMMGLSSRVARFLSTGQFYRDKNTDAVPQLVGAALPSAKTGHNHSAEEKYLAYQVATKRVDADTAKQMIQQSQEKAVSPKTT